MPQLANGHGSLEPLRKFYFCRETEVMPLSASMAMLSEERESLLKGRNGSFGSGLYLHAFSIHNFHKNILFHFCSEMLQKKVAQTTLQNMFS